MASFLTTRGENFAPSRGLHAGAEAVGFVTAAHFGLKGAFRQRELLQAGLRPQSKQQV
jgi:hypothetical protein